jgi:hypothetical protein
LVSEWGRDDIPTPSDDRSRVVQRTPSNGIQSENREKEEENRQMETDPSPNGKEN